MWLVNVRLWKSISATNFAHLPHHFSATVITCSQVIHMRRHNSLSVHPSVCLSKTVYMHIFYVYVCVSAAFLFGTPSNCSFVWVCWHVSWQMCAFVGWHTHLSSSPRPDAHVTAYAVFFCYKFPFVSYLYCLLTVTLLVANPFAIVALSSPSR